MMISLKTNPAWVLKSKNGWIKFGDVIVRWNTTWYNGEYVYFNIVRMLKLQNKLRSNTK